MKKNTITVSKTTLSEGRKKVAEELRKTKATDKEITLAELLIEESFFRLKKGMNGGEDFSANILVKSIFGSADIRMAAKGEEYNPVPKVTEQENEDETEAYRLAILKANRGRLRYVRKSEDNVVIINVHGLDAAKKQLIKTIGGLVLGTLCGLLMQMLLDAATIKLLTDSVIDPVRKLFLNALHMMMAPVTFFAIMAGVTNISDATLIGKLGGKMVVVSTFMQVITVALGLMLGIVVFAGDLSYMQAGITSNGGTTAQQTVSIKDMIFNIIPTNLVDPFKGDNILQVMFLAIFFGLIVNKMGEKAKGVVECVDFMFRFAIAVLKLIVKAIPLVVFLSMASLLASTGIDSIITLGGMFGGLFVGVILVWIVGAVTIFLFARISPLQMTKKIVALSPLVFSVSSSHARLPFVLEFCANKLGIDGKLAAFSIPVGVQLNKAGNCIWFSLATLMMMNVYGIELSVSLFLALWLSVFIMAVAKPPIPCGGIICIAYLFTVVGVPPEAISIIICVDPIAAMFNGVCNESSNITTSFILANDAKMLDKNKYFAS